MSDEPLNYPVMVSRALRDVVRQALSVVAQEGLPGAHQIFISFLTSAPGVVMAEALAQRYPEEMTLVFQHQFWDLEVDSERFRVGMSFHGRRQHLEIPFAAVTAYSDPSVPFGLRFDLPTEPKDEAEPPEVAPEDRPDDGAKPSVDNVIRFERPPRS